MSGQILSDLQVIVLGSLAVLFVVGAVCVWALEWIADREQRRFEADLEHLHERRKFQAITGGRR